jgi:ABC-type glutathione transport system ATPase component
MGAFPGEWDYDRILRVIGLMITLKAVSKWYDGKQKVTALDGVDLEIGRGEMVSIVGPSGCRTRGPWCSME